ncbi:MAG: ion channel [Syntrophomonas sp.]
MEGWRIWGGILIGITIASLINLLIDVPISAVFASLSVISGVTLIFVLFSDNFRIQPKIIKEPGMSLIGCWVMSFVSITVGFSSIYLDMVRHSPHHFSGIIDGISALYFSVNTFATVGFGDIYPVSSMAKFLVAGEIFIAIIVLPLTVGTSIAWIINYKINQQNKASIHDLEQAKQRRLSRIK